MSQIIRALTEKKKKKKTSERCTFNLEIKKSKILY